MLYCITRHEQALQLVSASRHVTLMSSEKVAGCAVSLNKFLVLGVSMYEFVDLTPNRLIGHGVGVPWLTAQSSPMSQPLRYCCCVT
jgi:hypothetical protein